MTCPFSLQPVAIKNWTRLLVHTALYNKLACLLLESSLFGGKVRFCYDFCSRKVREASSSDVLGLRAGTSIFHRGTSIQLYTRFFLIQSKKLVNK